MIRAAARTISELSLPNPAWWRRIAGGFGAFLFVGYIGLICVLAAVSPDLSWDSLAYAAAVFEWNGATPQAAHAAAYAAVESGTNPAQYQALVSGDPYRVAQAGSWQAFHSIQPLYTAKVGYIALLAALDPIAGGPLRAAWLVNWLSVAAFTGLICWWLHRRDLWIAAPVVVATLMVAGFSEAARTPLPDLPASTLILAGFFAFLAHRSWLALALFVAAFALRPDTLVLFIALVMAGLAARLEWKATLVALTVALSASVVMEKAVGHPGWWAHFYFSNVTIQPTLVGFDPAFSLVDLAKGYARGIMSTFSAFDWLAALLSAGFVSIIAAANGLRLDRRATALMAAVVLTIIGKFVLFPLPDDRLYMAFVLTAVLLVLVQIRPTFSAS